MSCTAPLLHGQMNTGKHLMLLIMSTVPLERKVAMATT
jgi:hypothetical protein